MSDIIKITVSDGHQYDAYFCEPKEAPKGIISVIHEIFGLTQFIKDVCEQWAAQGYYAIAPSLYDRLEKNIVIGYEEENYKYALDTKQLLMNVSNKQGLLGWDLQLLDIQAALLYGQENLNLPVAITGFSWGGTLSWLAACRLENIRCVVSYYGTHIYQFMSEKPKCPLLLHAADYDDLLTAEQVAEIKQDHPDITVYQYPAHHAFRCHDGKNYDKSASQLADARTVKFFNKYCNCVGCL